MIFEKQTHPWLIITVYILWWLQINNIHINITEKSYNVVKWLNGLDQINGRL